MKFELNKMGVRVSRRQEHLLLAKNVRLFSRVITVRRRIHGADTLGFLSAQFGNRFDSVNARLRAGERVYKQPGRFLRNTTIRSVRELFMSFKTSQFLQHLQFFLNELRGKDNGPARESTNLERVMLSQSPVRSLSRSNNRRELQRTSSSSAPSSSSSVMISLLTHQPRFRSDCFNTIMHGPLSHMHGALSQFAPAVTTASHFHNETFARLFARTKTQLTKTQLKSENYGSYRTRLQQNIAGPGRGAGTHRQTIVYAMAALSSAQHLTPLLPPQLPPPGQVNRQEQTENAQPGRRERPLDRTHSNREFRLVTPGSQVMNERSLINLISQHRDAAQPTHVLKRQSSAMTFSSHAKRNDSQRFQKTLSMLSLTAGSLVRQSTHEKLMSRSESRFAQFLTETSLFKDSQVSKFISRYRTIEKDRMRQEVAERTFIRKETGRPAPSNDFVLAQAHRHEPAAERVVKKIETREVVEIVRQELKQSMSAVTPLGNFTRRDYEEIGDQVYSSLVRRLTIERERLGLS
jgi:hypothetical protein